MKDPCSSLHEINMSRSSSSGNSIYRHWEAEETASMMHGDTSARLSYVAVALTVQNAMAMMLPRDIPYVQRYIVWSAA
jgi:hypothetical protein